MIGYHVAKHPWVSNFGSGPFVVGGKVVVIVMSVVSVASVMSKRAQQARVFCLVCAVYCDNINVASHHAY